MSDDDKDEIAQLATRADALRTAIARAQLELKAAAVEERAISDRLSELLVTSKSVTDAENTKTIAHETVIAKRHHHLSRNDAWKVAIAGAAAATLFGAIGLMIYSALTHPSSQPIALLPPTTSEAPTVVTTTTVIETDTPPPPPPAPAPPATIFPDPLNVHPRVTTPHDPNAPAMGALTVVCMPKCDEILDNGVSIGPGHVFNVPTSVGRHVLSLSTANGTHKTLRVDVVADQTREVRVAMEPARTTTASRSCDPPFVIDADGNKHFKPECLRDNPFGGRF